MVAENYSMHISPVPNFFIELFQKHNYIALGEVHTDTRLHNLVEELVPYFSKDGVKSICLEIDSNLQGAIDRYLTTGEETYLQEIIMNERRLVRKGFPFQKRLDSKYFDIIRNAFRHGIEVIAIKKNTEYIQEFQLDAREIDRYMASLIPEEGKTLIYAGELHLRKDFAIPLFRQEIFSISAHPDPRKIQNPVSVVSLWLLEILKEHPVFQIPCGISMNSQLGKSLDDYKTLRGLEPYSKWFDGLLIY